MFSQGFWALCRLPLQGRGTAILTEGHAARLLTVCKELTGGKDYGVSYRDRRRQGIHSCNERS